MAPTQKEWMGRKGGNSLCDKGAVNVHYIFYLLVKGPQGCNSCVLTHLVLHLHTLELSRRVDGYKEVV